MHPFVIPHQGSSALLERSELPRIQTVAADLAEKFQEANPLGFKSVPGSLAVMPLRLLGFLRAVTASPERLVRRTQLALKLHQCSLFFADAALPKIDLRLRDRLMRLGCDDRGLPGPSS